MEGRYRRVVDLVELTHLLQGHGPGSGTGITIDEIADRFEVSRRTAERMLRALRDRYPDLGAEVHHGRKYWRLRGGSGAVALEPAAEAWTSAGTLAEGMAQRIGEPLAALCAAAEQEPVGHELRQLAQRMRRVVERSLQLFGVEELKTEPTDAAALVSSVCEALRPRAREAGVELTPLVRGAKPWFVGDRAKLTRALTALVENAIEATPAGGRVRVEASPGAHPGSQRFRVDDEGPGVAPALRERIFEPYFTTRDEAAGLGLALARAIARRHGGGVCVLTTADPGASFVLEVASCQGAAEGAG